MLFKLDSGCPGTSSSFERKYNRGGFNMGLFLKNLFYLFFLTFFN